MRSRQICACRPPGGAKACPAATRLFPTSARRACSAQPWQKLGHAYTCSSTMSTLHERRMGARRYGSRPRGRVTVNRAVGKAGRVLSTQSQIMSPKHLEICQCAVHAGITSAHCAPRFTPRRRCRCPRPAAHAWAGFASAALPRGAAVVREPTWACRPNVTTTSALADDDKCPRARA
jgi:hypothetical protein